jgi:carbon monoxide dehydrogenase subunit G
MRLENGFEVAAPPDDAWSLLDDVPRIVPCIPGAELVETLGEDAWKATMQVKLGPIGLQFLVDVRREEADPAARRTLLRADAREVKGRGGARATIETSLEASGEGARVTIVTDLSLQGAVAQYGRGVVPQVAAQITSEFAACLARQLNATRA